jgi:hypothetical protein
MRTVLLKKSTFDDERAIPDFLWDRRTTVAELRAILADGEHPQRTPLLRTLLREARPDEVWSFVTPDLVVREWESIKPGLGKRLPFWTWLLGAWRDHGFLK